MWHGRTSFISTRGREKKKRFQKQTLTRLSPRRAGKGTGCQRPAINFYFSTEKEGEEGEKKRGNKFDFAPRTIGFPKKDGIPRATDFLGGKGKEKKGREGGA